MRQITLSINVANSKYCTSIRHKKETPTFTMRYIVYCNIDMEKWISLKLAPHVDWQENGGKKKSVARFGIKIFPNSTFTSNELWNDIVIARLHELRLSWSLRSNEIAATDVMCHKSIEIMKVIWNSIIFGMFNLNFVSLFDCCVCVCMRMRFFFLVVINILAFV